MWAFSLDELLTEDPLLQLQDQIIFEIINVVKCGEFCSLIWEFYSELHCEVKLMFRFVLTYLNIALLWLAAKLL